MFSIIYCVYCAGMLITFISVKPTVEKIIDEESRFESIRSWAPFVGLICAVTWPMMVGFYVISVVKKLTGRKV